MSRAPPEGRCPTPPARRWCTIAAVGSEVLSRELAAQWWLTAIDRPALLLLAVRIGFTRLIDNTTLSPPLTLSASKGHPEPTM